jgi:branched-subunit amino acid aminotransferase/4-amino-4-deoxychorismate lyase
MLENAAPHTLNGMSVLGEGWHPWRPSADSPWVDLDWCDPHEGRLLVADSWRVVDGRVRGLELHRDRFLAATGTHRPDSDDFWRDVVAALPRTGDWFPRVELRHRADGTQLGLRLRPTPPPSTEVVVATAPHDPRTQPLIKGPDLDRLQALRVAVQPSGAGEAIIVDAHGTLIEGAYSGLLWWKGETLVRPRDAEPRIPSVTVRLVLEAARADGVALAEADAVPAELEGCELWVLSALHGLRTATHWSDGPALAVSQQADRGRRWLESAMQEFDAASPALGGQRILRKRGPLRID